MYPKGWELLWHSFTRSFGLHKFREARVLNGVQPVTYSLLQTTSTGMFPKIPWICDSTVKSTVRSIANVHSGTTPVTWTLGKNSNIATLASVTDPVYVDTMWLELLGQSVNSRRLILHLECNCRWGPTALRISSIQWWNTRTITDQRLRIRIIIRCRIIIVVVKMIYHLRRFIFATTWL